MSMDSRGLVVFYNMEAVTGSLGSKFNFNLHILTGILYNY